MRPGNTNKAAQAGRPLRILVVDDDPLGRSLMEVMLAPHGYQIEFAIDGKEALECIETRTYDLVFMDLVLPDINGREVCHQVRAREAGQRHLPIVAVTAYDLPGQPLELVKAGMDDYIFKPYDDRTLRRMVQLYAVGDGNTASGRDASEVPIQLPDAPVLDASGPLEDFSNDTEVYQGLLRDFLQSLPVRLGKMRQAHAADDYQSLGREAHSLKGISAGLGAAALSRLASQLNKSCLNGGRDSAGELLAQVEQGMVELRTEAEVFLASTPAGPGSAAG